MTKDSLYLWNAPEGSENQGIKNVQNDRLDEILSKPLTGEDIALKVMMAQSEGLNPNLSMDEFKLYDAWHKQQEVKWWDMASGAVGTFFSDMGSGLASLTPFGKDSSGKERTIGSATMNLTTRLGPTATEALGRGTRDLVGLYQEASKNQNSPLYNLFNPKGDVYSRFVDFNKLADWRAQSQRIMEGKENVVMPNTSGMIGKDITSLTSEELFKVNNDLAQAGSYFLDPATILTLGESIGVKAGAKGALSGVMEGLSKNALKEGITGTESAIKNTAAHLDKGKIFGSGLTEKIGKSFRVAGESVDKPLNLAINWIKRQADELLDTNLHTTPNANLRITGPTKGQAGFGGSLMAGIGLGTFGLPYAAGIVPIWAVANASIIGGRFIETLGKEMANGAGVLGRMGLEQTSTGKLARMLSKWGPMGGYIGDMTKAVVKSGAYGAGIGYLASGEEGAAQGLGVGMAIGTTHYHMGVAQNIIKGRSREQMIAGLINNINNYRENGFTQKADTVLKYLSDIQQQHGDDAFFRNLGTYLAFEADSNVALSVWDKADYLRLKDDPTVPASVRDAILDVIGADGGSWNGMFLGRNGKSSPYFIHKDSQSGKVHVIINAWAKDINKNIQATGMKGEFYHVLADAYKEAVDKPRFIEEIYEGIARTFRVDAGPEGRKKLAAMFRNAADNLSFFGKDAKAQAGLPKRVLNHLRLTNEQAPKGWEVVHVVGDSRVNFEGFERPRYRWIARDENGGYAGYDIYEDVNGRYQLNKDGKPIETELPSLSMAFKKHRELTFKPSYEPTKQGEPPPNVAGQRESVAPAPEPVRTPEPEEVPPTNAERTDSVYRAIDLYEKTGKIDGDKFHILLEEMGESIFDAHEAEMPFDYIFLGGDLGFARNLIEEFKHRFSRIVDRNARQAGFVPDFNKPFVEWFNDKEGKAIVDPYMRKLFKKFLRVHRERNMNLDGYTLDISKLSPSMLKHFIEENGIEHEYDLDDRTGNYVRKPEEQINAEMHKRHQAAIYELLNAEKAGVATGFFYYSSSADAPNSGSLDSQHEGGMLKQEAWRDYRTTQEDILKAQRKGTIPTKEELEALVKRTGVWGNRNRPRTGDIDNLIAEGKKGSIIFTGIPTTEGFKILQKHLPKKQMEAIAKIAPLILDGGLTENNVARIKYAGFEHVDDATGRKMKRFKENWSAVEKSMVFYGMELRATMRNPKSGKFDYKTPHAAFLLHGVDIDVLQRRIQWMWKNEKETRKRWSNLNEFEKDVYRLVENYSAKSAIGGSRFFGGGDEGKAKKRLACAAIGAFPTRKMVEGLDADDVEFDLPEIDWHHYQLRSYGKGKNGKDIPWTAIRADAIRSVIGTDDKMRIPYAERAYYRTQELYQQNKKSMARDDQDIPVSVRTISLDVSTNPHSQKSFAGDKPDIMYRRSTRPFSYTPSDVIKEMRSGSVTMGARSAENLKAFVKGGIGHDEATDSVLVYWHGYGTSKPFSEVEMGQFGMHIGTLQAAMTRNYRLAFDRNVPLDASYNNLMPLVVNIKKPLKLVDRGLWTPQNIAESILASLKKDQRDETHPNTYESASYRANIREQIGEYSDADISFLTKFIERQKQLRAKDPNAYQKAQIGLLSSDTLTPDFIKHSQEQYKESKTLHQWLRSKGFDSISYYNRAEGSALSYIIFDGKNAKNLAENVGEFSPESISMLRQEAATFGSRSPEERASLRSNYEAAVKEGDIFNAISIKNNFLKDMPPTTRIIRQSAEEAAIQGVPFEQYNSQFATGTPFVMPMLHSTKSKSVAMGQYAESFGVVGGKDKSHFNSIWWGSHMDVAKYFRDFHAANSGKNKAFISRALIKSQNPLVIDAKGAYWNNKEFNINKWLRKGVDGGHDSVLFLNVLDDVEDPNNRPSLLPHNQLVVFPEHANDNIAVIDYDGERRKPVPRGLGLVNDIPVELPFRQEAADTSGSKEEAKRTFYSAVEKFVQEKVTDKTSLQELMGLLDPTRGTGIVKSELEFLDIASWVEEQKKLNPSTKAKVDKAALLEYIRTHKFELQEDKTNTAWYSLMGMDPNNPQVQSQVEGGYESYAPANKGYDELHPSTNYRVLLLRGPHGEDYSGGEGGHFKEHENIIAFARVSDVYLDRDTEMPSPPKNGEKIKLADRFLPKGYREKQILTIASAIDSFQYQLENIIPSLFRTPFKEIESTSSHDLVDRFLSKTVDTYSDGTRKPSEESLSNLGFTFEYLSDSNPEAGLKIAKRMIEIINNNFNRTGTFAFMADERVNRLNKYITEVSDPNFDITQGIKTPTSYFALLRRLFDNADKQDAGDSGFYQLDADKRIAALVDMVDLFKSLMSPEELEIVDTSKKKMLFVMELQSDTAQKMQSRNDNKTAGIRTPQEQARLDVVLDEIKKTKIMMDEEANRITKNYMDREPNVFGISDEERFDLYKADVISRTFELQPELHRKLNELVDERAMLGNKKEAIIVSNRDFKKSPEYQKAKTEIQRQFDHYHDLKSLFENPDRDISRPLGEYSSGVVAEALDRMYSPEDSINPLLIAGIAEERKNIERAFISIATEIAINMKDEIYIDDKFTDFRITEGSMMRLYDKALKKYIDGIGLDNMPSKEIPAEGPWSYVIELSLSDPNSVHYDAMRNAVISRLKYRMNVQYGALGAIDFRYTTPEKAMESSFFSGNSNIILTESMPFLRTEDFSKLMFKKLLKEMVDGGYEGIILIPPELPQALTGGDSKWYYSKILPKVMEGYTKKWGGKLRKNKSLSDIDYTSKKQYLLTKIDSIRKGNAVLPDSERFNFTDIYRFMESMWDTLSTNQRWTMKEIQDTYAGSRGEYYKETFVDSGPYVSQLSRFLGFAEDDAANIQFDIRNQEHRDALAKSLTLRTVESKRKGHPLLFKKVLDYLAENHDNPENKPFIFGSINGDGHITFKESADFDSAQRQASRRGLILDRTPQMDVIKEGQPLWQAAARQKKPKETPAETLGELQGQPKNTRKKKEIESGMPIVEGQSVGRGLEEGISMIVDNKTGLNRPMTDVEKEVTNNGIGQYRGYKIMKDALNGGYKLFNPAGKSVQVPYTYMDRATGEKVVKMEKHVLLIQEGVELIDRLLGGLPKNGEPEPANKPDKPAKVNKPQQAPATQQVVAPERRAIPQQDPISDLDAVNAQVKAGKVADYYGIYKVGFDPKMNGYYAMDNGGQKISILVPSKFQSGPRMLSGTYHPDLSSLLQQLDKKFDKTKYANKAPSAIYAPQQTAPVAPVVAPVPAEAPKPAPRRVEASSVPPAVARAVPAPKPKPQDKPQPAPKPKASIPSEPEVVMPKPEPVETPQPATKPRATIDPAAPAEVVPDMEHLEHQAKALGKGFIEMMKDPELAQYILDSLNRDDNLTLVGTSEDASTADGRFSVSKKGKKLYVVQNDYTSPITGIKYDKRPIAYVNNIQQAQLIIRRLELERMIALKARGMASENGLVVMARENPAFVEMARMQEFKDAAFIKMLLSMRDQNITPIMIDPNTLVPLLVMLPSEPAIAQISRPKPKIRIAGMLPENGTQGESMPLAIYDKAIMFDMFEDAEIRGLDYNTKNVATRFRNALGYEILKFNNKFRLFNPNKTAISVRDDEEAVMNDLIADIHRNGLQK